MAQRQHLGAGARPGVRVPKLMAQRQHLGAELGVAATADYQDLDQEPEQVVEDGVKHDRGSIAGRPAGR
jgi:hypothetical protein